MLNYLCDGVFGAYLRESLKRMLLETTTSNVLNAARMKLGFAKTVGAAVALAGLVQAQCPDYTTFSQVCRTVAGLYVKMLILDTIL